MSNKITNDYDIIFIILSLWYFVVKMYVLFEIVLVIFNYYCFEGTCLRATGKISLLLLTVLSSWNKVITYLLT